jgi:thiol-disulfide isomerase/thioredoxin
MKALTALLALAVVALALAGCPGGGDGGTGQPAGTQTAQQGAKDMQDTPEIPDVPTPPAQQQGMGGTQMASNFDYTHADGRPAKLSDHLGQPVVINFWADWCPPCVAELPHFEEVWQEKGGQFDMVAIAVESAKDPQAFWAENGFTIPMATDVSGAQTYQVQGIPTTLFINKDGMLVDKIVGGIDKATFEAHLAKIL